MEDYAAYTNIWTGRRGIAILTRDTTERTVIEKLPNGRGIETQWQKTGPSQQIDLVDISTISSDRRACTYYAAKAACGIDGIYIKRNLGRKIWEIVAAALTDLPTVVLKSRLTN